MTLRDTRRVDLKDGMQSEVIAWLIVKMVELIDYFKHIEDGVI
jgi:hypothetical protein